MTVSRHIRLNAFDMACVGHIQHGMWTHPRDRSSDYTSLDHWVRLARMLERGLFDGLFLADVLGAYDVYGGMRTPRCELACRSRYSIRWRWCRLWLMRPRISASA